MMLSRANWLILGLAVLAATIGGYIEHRQARLAAPAESILVGQPAPALTLPDLDGKQHDLADYRGRRILLNFWATWCAPCLEEMPALSAAQEKFGVQGGSIIGIAMDEPVRIRAFLARHPVTYPIVLGKTGIPSTTSQWGNAQEMLPYSVLIDGDGRVLATHAGALSEAQLQRWLSPASKPR